MVHNGGSPNFKGLLFDKNKTYMAQILQSLCYKVCPITLPNFNTFGCFIPVMGTSTIMDQTGCFYIRNSSIATINLSENYRNFVEKLLENYLKIDGTSVKM